VQGVEVDMWTDVVFFCEFAGENGGETVRCVRGECIVSSSW